jgi:subtilisin family serine protease
MDTGVAAGHPDIAANYDRRLSRDFTGARRAGVDPIGHGTHVAGIVGAPVNGIGIAGVAPGVDLVSLRVGDDAGYFFVQPTVDALTYAADNGIDVVNMSYYVDPWLYNCAANPADSPQEQQDQRTILEATQRALDYARERGVTLVAALGNERADLDHSRQDASSPDFPGGRAHPREVDSTCKDMPAEGEGVLGVSAVALGGTRASYSDYGVAQNDFAAPGGDSTRPPGTRVLGPVPARTVQRGSRDAVRSCARGRCAYYAYIEGTSMAAPHVAGVAALIVARYGAPDPVHGGLTLPAARVEEILTATARHHACPSPSRGCTGTPERNSFYGRGLVDARAVGGAPAGPPRAPPPAGGAPRGRGAAPRPPHGCARLSLRPVPRRARRPAGERARRRWPCRARCGSCRAPATCRHRTPRTGGHG